MKKTISQRKHARARAMQRYGLDIGRQTRSELTRAIQSNQAVFIKATSNRVKSFAVYHQGTWYAVVYDNQRKEIVTFLPEEYLLKHQNLIDRFGYKCADAHARS